ncbi:undecaprenyldiphospho-muramoylpentapeptide beta-N-acetylglucosaminyltransferase [Riemerella anatipestifer]|nr:undecaprenyldiphospho-muramoylpentapeptide beta-N-acetylglucosaminyltransferase [Riemerella anatipestifer]
MSENIHHINQDFAPRVLMSGGGTGGHIFPAIAIAQEIQRRFPKAEFLFIGAENKMEMERVPQAGFRIEGLKISGFNRSSLLANFKLPFKIVSSVRKANRIIKDFKPHVAIGTGGFASGPALYMASRLGVPTFVQEQNSLPGKTNLFLGKKAKAVFTAYPDMAHFFPKTQTIFSGNPIRQSLMEGLTDTATAKEKLRLDPNKLSILSVGGSLGSRTLNNGWLENLERIKKEGWQLIWQTGKTEYQTIKDKVNLEEDTIQLKEFITDMALAYSAADVIVSRAGAIAISELSVVKKPILLVPLPFAAEDHQTKNAMVLVEKNAARMVKDVEMKERFWNMLSEICGNENLRKEMGQNLSYFAKPKATEEIVDEIIKIFK